jgi:hypothetical protein
MFVIKEFLIEINRYRYEINKNRYVGDRRFKYIKDQEIKPTKKLIIESELIETVLFKNDLI